MPYRVVPCRAVLSHPFPYHTMPSHAMSFYAVPGHTTPQSIYHSRPHYVTPWHTTPHRTMLSCHPHDAMPFEAVPGQPIPHMHTDTQIAGTQAHTNTDTHTDTYTVTVASTYTCSMQSCCCTAMYMCTKTYRHSYIRKHHAASSRAPTCDRFLLTEQLHYSSGLRATTLWKACPRLLRRHCPQSKPTRQPPEFSLFKELRVWSSHTLPAVEPE